MVIFSTNKKNTGKKKEKIVCTKMMLEKNVCGNVYVNMKAIFAVMNTTQAVVKEGLKKNSGLYGIWTYDLCDIGALLYQMS